MLDLKFYLDDVDVKIDQACDEVQTIISQHLSDFIDKIEIVADDLEWPGIFYALQYAKDVRTLVYSHAEKLVEHCQQIALNISLTTVAEVEKLSINCCEEDLKPEKEALNLILDEQNKEKNLFLLPEFNEFLDNSDKIGIVKEFGPATIIFTTGLLGFKGVFKNFFSSVGLNAPKTLFAGLAIAGTGMFLFALSDIRRVLLKKVVQKIRIHLNDLNYTSFNSEKILKVTRRSLTSCLYDFNTKFDRALKINQFNLAKREEKKNLVKSREIFFKNLENSSINLDN
ncbi:hypothetical protein HK099_003190, partial [Clydaea vesicula]